LNLELQRLPGIERMILSPFIWIVLKDFFLRSTGKAIGDYGMKWAGNAPGLRLY